MSSIPANSPLEQLIVEIIGDACLAIPVEFARIETAVRSAAGDQGFTLGEIGVRFTDDSTIRQLNRDHLHHDYATDVISFHYARSEPFLQGEMVVSVETAIRQAGEIGWTAENELLLYVVHGTLHLTGLDDQAPLDQAAMRRAEQRVMMALGINQIQRFGPGQEPDE